MFHVHLLHDSASLTNVLLLSSQLFCQCKTLNYSSQINLILSGEAEELAVRITPVIYWLPISQSHRTDCAVVQMLQELL